MYNQLSMIYPPDDSKIEKHEKHIREDDYKPKKYTPILVVMD